MSILDIPVMRPSFSYQMTAIKRAKSGREIGRRVSAESPNVFLNSGVERMYGLLGGISGSSLAAAVGTGNTLPLITQTTLASFLAGRVTTGAPSYAFVDNGDNTGTITLTKSTLFLLGAVVGNIAEVGAVTSQIAPTALTVLSSRALVVDEIGDPTVFEVLADEELLLTKIFRVNVSLLDIVYNNVPVAGGPDQQITLRPYALSNPGSYWPIFGSFAQTSATQHRLYWGDTYTLPSPTGSSGGSSSGTGSGQANTAQGVATGVEAYVPESKQRVVWLRRNTGDVRNIVGAEFNMNHGSYAVKLDPGVPKSNLQRFTIGVRYAIDNTPA